MAAMAGVAGAGMAMTLETRARRGTDSRAARSRTSAARETSTNRLDVITAIDKLDKIGWDGVIGDLAQRGMEQAQVALLERVLVGDGDGNGDGNARRLDTLDELFRDRTETGRAGAAALRALIGLLD